MFFRRKKHRLFFFVCFCFVSDSYKSVVVPTDSNQKNNGANHRVLYKKLRMGTSSFCARAKNSRLRPDGREIHVCLETLVTCRSFFLPYIFYHLLSQSNKGRISKKENTKKGEMRKIASQKRQVASNGHSSTGCFKSKQKHGSYRRFFFFLFFFMKSRQMQKVQLQR